jgi:hypothetical protein
MESRRMIIGLTGYAQSGKDTVASILVEQYGYTRVAFADKVRELLYELDPPFPMENGKVVGLQNLIDVYGWDSAKQNELVRSMLQNLGLGARKLFGPNVWVNEAMKTMLNDPRPDLKYVVTDVRFLNEADMIKANHGQIWRVERPGINAVNSHVSESQMDGYEINQTFLNNSSVEDLSASIKARMVGLLA